MHGKYFGKEIVPYLALKLLYFQIYRKEKMANRKSKVWKYFEAGRNEDGCKTGTCRICDQPRLLRCPQNTTTPLWKHLEKEHKEEYFKIKSNPVQGVKKDNRKLRQPTILDVTSKKIPYGRDHPKQKQFDENVKNQIINDCVPFRIADSESFRKTVSDLDPKIKVKTGSTYSRQIRKDEQKIKSKIRKIVKRNAKGLLALTTDMWEDRKGNSYCSLTAHFIGSDFKMVRVTPAIKYFGTARHKSENIAAVLTEEIQSVKGDTNMPIVLVSDSTSNMVKMRELLKEAKVIDVELGCTLHKMQNAIKDTNKETKGVKKAAGKAKKLVKFLRKSRVANNQLKKACSKAGHAYKKLKTCTDIRWNSEYDSFERLLYHQECIEELDRSRHLDKVSSSVLNREEWRQLAAVVDILKPVKISTKILEAELEPTINRVTECLYELDEGLKEKINSDETPRNAKAYAKNLKKNLRNRFPAFGLHERLFGYGNFLDPHLKGIHLEHESLMDPVTESVEKMISKYDVEDEQLNEDNNNSEEILDEQPMTATQKLMLKKRNPVSNVFDLVEDETAGEKAAREEIDVYKKLPSCDRSDDVLSWWDRHSNLLPRLCILAKEILCIPAASAASERLFSIGGLFDTPKRGNMDTETLELLTLLKTNKRAFEKYGVDKFGDASDEELDGYESEDEVDEVGDETSDMSCEEDTTGDEDSYAEEEEGDSSNDEVDVDGSE